MTREEAAKEIKDLLWNQVEVEVDIDETDLEAGMDVDALENVVDIDRAINEQSDIIYYSRAIKFLAENDPSLTESLEIAEELGYKPGDLNSEVLASLLNNNRMREEYYKRRDDIQEILDQIEDDEEEEE